MPHLSLHYGEEETRKIAYEKISALVKPETTTYTVTGIEGSNQLFCIMTSS